MCRYVRVSICCSPRGLEGIRSEGGQLGTRAFTCLAPPIPTHLSLSTAFMMSVQEVVFTRPANIALSIGSSPDCLPLSVCSR